MMMLLVALFLGNIPSFVFSASSQPNINCLIINLDYVNCTWTEHEHNYTFRSRFTPRETLDCPEYLRIDGVNVGCVFPYKTPQRFNTLETRLYSDDGGLVTEQEHYLKTYVKLSPPINLSVVEKKDTELWLYWDFTKNSGCFESEVRYRTDNNLWKNTAPGPRTSFSLPFPSKIAMSSRSGLVYSPPVESPSFGVTGVSLSTGDLKRRHLRSNLQQRLWKDDTKEFCRGMRTVIGYKL